MTSMLCLFVLTFAAPGDEQNKTPALTPVEILDAVKQLGAPKLTVREEATEKLWKAGLAAESSLKDAAKSTDAEVRYRARAILEKFRYGLFFDTPAEVAAIIQQFRNGDTNGRLQALKQLQTKGDYRTLLTLMNAEKDEEIRKQLRQQMLQDTSAWIGPLVTSGQFDALELLLEESVSTDVGLSALVMFHAVQGTLDQRLAKLREQQSEKPTPDGAKLLAYLLRAKGDLPGAREAARKAEDKQLQLALSVEMLDWAEAARLNDATLPAPGAGREYMERIGYSAAYHRLANNQEKLSQTVDRIKKLAIDHPNQAWFCAEALLINDKPNEGIELVRKAVPAVGFELLCYQQKYREALDFAGLKEGKKPDAVWYMSLPDENASTASYRVTRFNYGLSVARALASIGEHEIAAGVFQQLIDVIEKQPTTLQFNMWGQLAASELRLGMKEKAFEHAAKTLTDPDRTQVLRPLFGTRAAEAELWWKFFRQKSDDNIDISGKQEQERLTKIDSLLNPWIRTKPEEVDPLRAFADEAAKMAEAMEEKDRGPWLTSLAETCLSRQHRDLAFSYLELAAKTSEAAALRRADLALEDKNWESAAHWYQIAWERDRQQAIALYLQGYALEKAGQESAGKTLRKQADLLALGARPRHTLGVALQTRGLNDEALAQFDLLLRTGNFGDWYGDDASKRTGDLMGAKNPLRVASLWERVALGCLRTSSSFIDPDGYLRFPFLIHKQRALGHIADGNWDQAKQEVDLGLTIIPGDVRMAEDIVPAYAKAGRQADADKLFESTFQVQEKLCADWPRSPIHHNNLAWVAARAHRKLDEALKYAQKATSFSPQNSAYLDTLAEVHFHRGDRAAAIECSQRCLELAPRMSFYKEQLERFKNAPIPNGK